MGRLNRKQKLVNTFNDMQEVISVERLLANSLVNADCLEAMKYIEDKSIDMILCDLPYGTTACKWDTIIPFEPLWKEYKRLIKDNGAIVLTASQPFTSALVMSNPAMFRYEWIWEKSKSTGYMNARKAPMKAHENILIFYNRQQIYNPQGLVLLSKNVNNFRKGMVKNEVYGKTGCKEYEGTNESNFPRTVIKISNPSGKGHLHPTQKPVALFEYLIRTYTNEGDTVLDNCAGSGTTAIACLNTGRKFILIEKDAGYCEIIRKRIEKEKHKTG